MNDTWKTIIPTLATALGGPLAGLASKFIVDKLNLPADSVENITAIVSGMPSEKLNELKQHEEEFKIQIAQLGYDAQYKIEQLNIDALTAINSTIQAEAKSENWPTYSWRPFNGFLFGTTIFCCYFLLPLINKPIPNIPEWVWLAWGSILGVASYFRGKMQSTGKGE